MRLKMRVAVGMLVVSGIAFSMPADDQSQNDGSTTKPGKLGHLFMFHKTTKKTDTSSKSQAAAKPQVTHDHGNGFPEPDKKGSQYQPQTTNNQWAGDMWKTNQNKDTFKQTDAK